MGYHAQVRMTGQPWQTIASTGTRSEAAHVAALEFARSQDAAPDRHFTQVRVVQDDRVVPEHLEHAAV